MHTIAINRIHKSSQFVVTLYLPFEMFFRHQNLTPDTVFWAHSIRLSIYSNYFLSLESEHTETGCILYGVRYTVLKLCLNISVDLLLEIWSPTFRFWRSIQVFGAPNFIVFLLYLLDFDGLLFKAFVSIVYFWRLKLSFGDLVYSFEVWEL